MSEKTEEKKNEQKQPEVIWRKLVIETNGKEIRMTECQMSVLELKEIGRSLTAL